MEWNNKVLQKVTVFSKLGGKTILVSGNKKQNITLKKDQKIDLIW
jgi:alpha-L-fucosidase 2